VLPPERQAAVDAAQADWEAALGKWTESEKAISSLHAARGTRSPGWGDIVAVPPGDPELARLTEEYNRWQKAMNDALDAQNAAQYGRQRGHMYEVEIGYPEQALLDWDTSLRQQPEAVQAYARRAGIDADGSLDGRWGGEQLWWRRRNSLGPQDAARELLEAGIPGIRYYDAGSRRRGAGTSNYVMFPGTEDRIRILRQYGLLPPLVGAGMMGEEE